MLNIPQFFRSGPVLFKDSVSTLTKYRSDSDLIFYSFKFNIGQPFLSQMMNRFLQYFGSGRIRVFSADPDLDLNHPDPSDICFNKLMWSNCKWYSLIRFWRNLTKKDSVESAKYHYDKQFFFICTRIYIFLAFFPWIRIRIGIFWPIRFWTKGPGSETLGFCVSCWTIFLSNRWVYSRVGFG